MNVYYVWDGGTLDGPARIEATSPLKAAYAFRATREPTNARTLVASVVDSFDDTGHARRDAPPGEPS